MKHRTTIENPTGRATRKLGQSDDVPAKKLDISANHLPPGARFAKAAIAASANTGHPQSGATVSILNINLGTNTNTDNDTLPATTKLGCGC